MAMQRESENFGSCHKTIASQKSRKSSFSATQNSSFSHFWTLRRWKLTYRLQVPPI